MSLDSATRRCNLRMSESEEERRLRKEKKREAARRAAEKVAEQKAAAAAGGEAADAKSTDTGAVKETEEERRIRKERKRAQREAAAKRQAEQEAAVAAPPAAASGKTKDEERARRKAKNAAAVAAAAVGVQEEQQGISPVHHHHHHHHHHSSEEGKHDNDVNAPGAAAAASPGATAEATSASTANKTTPVDQNTELLSAIEAENNAVAAARSSARNSAIAAVDSNRSSAGGGGAASRAETEEERAARKQAEREERRRQRHAAKAAAAAAAAAGGGANETRADAVSADRKRVSGTPTPAPGLSPTTDLAPGELQRQAYRAQFQRDVARATALRRLVDFDSSGGVVLDLAPQTAYDLYIRDFGQSGREQAGVQAPPEEERLDVATQAERRKLRTRGTQAPDDLGLCPEEEAERQFFQLRRSAMQRGGRADDGAGDGGAGDEDNADDNNTNTNSNGGGEVGGVKSGSNKATRSVDAALLERFLTSTLPLMSAVLDENNATASGAAAAAAATSTDGGGGKSKGSTAFSSSYRTFCWRGTRNRPLVRVLLNPANTRQLLALHGPSDESGPSPVLDTYMSVLLLWNVYDTTTPERVLVSFSTVTSICVSMSRPYLVYGGTEDGNVCVWSLREPDRLHLAAGRYERAVFHLPSYSTSWQADGHAAPVRQVRVSGYNSQTPSHKEEHEQLASMDEQGMVCFWVVTEKESAGKAIQVIDNDYGQHPFTSVSLRLAKGTLSAAPAAAGAATASTFDYADATTTDAGAVAYAAGVTSSFDFSPLDAAQYVLTAPHGVVRRSRFGGIAVPSLYSASQAAYFTLSDAKNSNNSNSSADAAAAATALVVAVPCCVQYNAIDPRWFVVGYEDGTLRLFLSKEATPQLTVEVGYHPIVAVRCSGTTPWVVWALDESGEVHMIEFAHHNRQMPRLSHPLTQPDTGVCTCMDVSAKDEKADQRMLVAGFEKGMVQLHTLDAEKLRIANAERDEKWI